ncbi:MAG: 23S rRNA pseudouridine(2604) synthase RluF [Halioglobus sp.]
MPAPSIEVRTAFITSKNGMLACIPACESRARLVDSKGSIRLNKFISESGHCSRREADKLIDSNRVKINGRRPELGSKVEPGDVVTVDGREILASAPEKSDRVYIVYNKPVGITCTTERSVKGNIVDAIDHHERIFPIGRLDKPSEGLILLTSDGDIVNKILRAENAHEKEYLVTVNKSIGKGFAEKMSGGIPILDTVTKPCKVSVVKRNVFKITLTQGLNRQIRRMCEYLGYDVTQLVRLRIMNVHLGKLKVGQWRNLTEQEMNQLNNAIAGSTGEPPKQGTLPPAKKRKPTHSPKKTKSGGNSDRKPDQKKTKAKKKSKRISDPGSGTRRSSRRPGGKKSSPSSKRRK